MIYLDTHLVVRLFAYGADDLTDSIREILSHEADIRISPMVRLEIQYLNEIGRVTYPAISILDSLGSSLGLSVCNAPFSAIVKAAEGLTWTRDPFDQLIVAQASLFDAPLLTKDEKIHAHYPHATW